MKRSIQEIGMGTYNEPPGPPSGKNPWSGRMGWKPGGKPRLSDEERAQLGPPGDLTADDLLDTPTTASPAADAVKPLKPSLGDEGEGEGNVPIKGSRFGWTPGGEGAAKPPKASLAELLAEIKAEQAKPTYEQNAARLARLKAEALELMSQEESRRVQRQADRLIPPVNG